MYIVVWLDRRLIEMIHDRQISQHGGSTGLRDAGLLESALARPQQKHAYGDPPPDLADLAASLAFGLARNHAFVDGNKRTAHVCYRTFLEANGATLQSPPEQKYVRVLALAEGRLSEVDFAAWIREHLQTSTTPPSVQETRTTYRKARRPVKAASKQRKRSKR